MFSKNRFFGTTHGDAWTPHLRSPSLIMAPVFTYLFLSTVEPRVSDHPYCQGYVVAYGRWSLTRGQTTGGRYFG